jgi:hypothetical protein
MGALLTRTAEDVGLTRVNRFRFLHARFNATFQRGFGTSIEKLTHVLVLQRG